MNKYIVFFNDIQFSNLYYYKGVKYRISREDKDNYILNQYIEPLIVSKKFENKDYSVGDIIVESNRYNY